MLSVIRGLYQLPSFDLLVVGLHRPTDDVTCWSPFPGVVILTSFLCSSVPLLPLPTLACIIVQSGPEPNDLPQRVVGPHCFVGNPLLGLILVILDQGASISSCSIRTSIRIHYYGNRYVFLLCVEVSRISGCHFSSTPLGWD